MEPDENTLQDESGFNDGFAGPPTESPLATAPAPEPDDTTAAPPPAPKLKTVTEEEWTSVMQRAALIDEMKATQSTTLDKVFGKLGGVERSLQELRTGVKVDISDDEIDAVEEDWPAVATLLRKVRQAGVAGEGAAIDEDALNQLVEQRIAPVLESLPQKVTEAVELRLLAKAHPDWKQQTEDPAFAEYVSRLPEADQNTLRATWDADVISGHLTTFKKARKAATSRQSELAEAITPRGAGGATPGPTVEDAFNAGVK